MDWPHKLCIAAFLLASAAIHGAHGGAMVSGTVFCDQCKDGQISLFDYPLYGIKVAIACGDGNGQMTTWREETTNWFGNYNMRFDGTPDLGGCYAQILGSGQGSRGCGAATGPARPIRLMFRMFDMEMYTVDPLLSQPAQPMSICPRSATPVPTPENPVKPPPVTPVTPPPLPPAITPFTPPPVRLPPLPFLEASACTFRNWTVPEHKCYWRAVSPDMKVAVVFGVIAARRYGTDMTLWEGMRGRGDPYRTLLREATTALLNSYNSVQFSYNPLGVVQHTNSALMGSTSHLLHTALRFMRANSGFPNNMTCKFTPCK